MNVRANLLDRAIGVVAPRAAYRRMQWRSHLDAARGYSGAAVGRHTDGWKAPSTSADTEIATAGPRLRDRSRDLGRNNPHAAKAVSDWTTSIVGDGIMPRCRNKKAMKAFKKWASQCDADGQLDFYGIQSLLVRGMIEGGEMLCRRRWRRASDGLTVPLQLHVIEPDLIDSTKNGATSVGNVAVQGIEFNQIGQRTAYWLYGEHPGNTVVSFLTRRLESVAVPAAEVIHVYEKQRTQVRGVPWGAPVIRALRDLDDLNFAEGLRKKMESSYVGAILADEDDGPGAPGGVTGNKNNVITDARGNAVEQFEPGLFVRLFGAKDIKFNAPAAVSGAAEYEKLRLKAIAAGYRIPYELLSGDLSEVNFSSIRAGMLQFRRLVRVMQWQVVIPIACQRIWDWFCEAAFLAGVIDKPTIEVEWDTPRFEWVDPYKDVMADILALRAGFKSWHEMCAERGRDPEEVLRELVEFNEMADKYGLVLDIDPRKTSRAGLTQARPDGTKLPGTQLPSEESLLDDEDADDEAGSRRAKGKIVRIQRRSQ